MRYAFLFCFLFCFFSCRPTNVDTEEPVASTPVPTDTIIAAEEKPPLPVQVPDFDTTQWLELSRLDSTLQIDLKYATTDNFVEEKMYECGRCFLRPEVAQAVVKVQGQLQLRGLGLKLLDCYRPRPIQQKLWEKVPNPSYVTPPKKGSMHNRGRAVDLTLVDAAGQELDMGTPFDFFGPRAHHTFTDLPDSILQRRILLKDVMEDHGFRPIRTEWWHYYYSKPGHQLDDWLWDCE